MKPALGVGPNCYNLRANTAARMAITTITIAVSSSVKPFCPCAAAYAKHDERRYGIAGYSPAGVNRPSATKVTREGPSLRSNSFSTLLGTMAIRRALLGAAISRRKHVFDSP